MDKIYILTVIRTKGEDIEHQRTVGLYPTEFAASSELVKNDEYLSECYYQWAVIEEYPIAFLPIAREVSWFYWDGATWIKVAKPPILEIICNFAF